MRITRNQLKNLIAEEIGATNSVLLEMPMLSTTGTKMHAQDPGGRDDEQHHRDEGEIARQSLYHLARQADQLHDILMADENIEPEVSKKISLAAKYIEESFKAIMYEKDNPDLDHQ